MEAVLKILVIDENANSADRSVSIIKSSGFAVREVVVSSKQQLDDIAEELDYIHLVIQSPNVADIDISDIRALFNDSDHEAPIIINNCKKKADAKKLLENGATAVADEINDLKSLVSSIAQTELYIQSLKSVQNEFNELESRYQKILDSSRDAICYIHEGLHSYANRSYLELFGISDTEEAEALSILELVEAEEQAKLKTILKDISKNHKAGTTTLQFKTAEDEIQSLELEYNPVSIDGEISAQFVIYQEANQSKELQEQLSYLSERDQETGFLHRKSIIDKIEEVLKAVHEDDQPASSFIEIDIANIDEIQDRFGVAAIDKIHGSLAESLRPVCSEDELLAKLTDDSFGILTTLNSEEDLSKLGEKIKQALNDNSIQINDTKITPEFHFGAVIIDTSIDDVSSALSSAKSACDYAWENEIEELYIVPNEPRSLTGTLLDQKWTKELQDAIKDNRLRLLFQPVVSIVGQSEDRYQVFTQLVSQEGAKISVAEVLPSIERSGVSVMLDQWVIKSALTRLAEHTANNPNSLFFVKLTAGCLNDCNFIDWLKDQFEQTQVDPNRLVIDLREETIVSHLKEAREFAIKLREIGCQIAIDAFGMGQHPDKILSMIPATYLKLSFQLMAGLKEGNSETIDSIKQICDQAKSKDAKVIAQFIESAQALSSVWTLNVDFVSGDFFQKPNELLEYDFSSAA